MKKFDPYNYFGFLTHRVSRLIDLNLDPHLKELGYDMPPSCIGVLADLWQSDGMNQKELGLSVIKTKSSINKILAALTKNGLIEKKEDQNDKRSKLIFLTQKGHNLRFDIEKIGLSKTRDLLPDMTAEEIKTAKKVLKTLYHNLCDKNLILNR